MSLIVVNGNIQSTVSALDRGVLYGDSLFETIAFVNNKALLLDDHLARLKKGVSILGFNVDFSILEKEICSFISKIDSIVLPSKTKPSTIRPSIIRITLTRGEQSRGYKPERNSLATRILSLHDWPQEIPKSMCLTLSDVCYSQQPLLAGIKHANRLEQVLASHSIPKHVNDVVMLDHQGSIISCTKGNIFIKYDKVWTTPNLDNCGIEGVVRNRLISWFNMQTDMMFEQKMINIKQIQQYPDSLEAAFVCNSIIGVVPIHSFVGIDLPSNMDHKIISDEMISQGFIV